MADTDSSPVSGETWSESEKTDDSIGMLKMLLTARGHSVPQHPFSHNILNSYTKPPNKY